MGAYDFYPMPRSSLHSVRKASYDVRSVGSDGIYSYNPSVLSSFFVVFFFTFLGLSLIGYIHIFF